MHLPGSWHTTIPCILRPAESLQLLCRSIIIRQITRSLNPVSQPAVLFRSQIHPRQNHQQGGRRRCVLAAGQFQMLPCLHDATPRCCPWLGRTGRAPCVGEEPGGWLPAMQGSSRPRGHSAVQWSCVVNAGHTHTMVKFCLIHDVVVFDRGCPRNGACIVSLVI